MGYRRRLQSRQGSIPCREIIARQWGVLLFAFISQVVATFVYLRRPRETAARVLFIWAWAGSHSYAWSLGLQLSDITGVVGFWLYRSAATGLWLLYWPAILHFALIFPKTHPACSALARLHPCSLSGILSYRLIVPRIPMVSRGKPAAADRLHRRQPNSLSPPCT